MNKKKLFWICALLVVAVLCSAVYALCARYADRSKYYGIIEPFDAHTKTFSDGSTVYTPGSDHIAEAPTSNILYYDNLLLVFTARDLTDAQIRELADAADGQTVGVIRGAVSAVQLLVKPAGFEKLRKTARALMTREDVLYSSCEYPVQIMNTPAQNAAADDLWWVDAIDAQTAWSYSAQCQEVRVGIVDNGFDMDHPALQGKLQLITNPHTPKSHGTHVAGIIAGLDNGTGFRGIAPSARLYCADLWPAHSNNSYHTMAEFLAAVNLMVQNGVRIINNSWGCKIPTVDAYIRHTYGIFSKLSGIIPMDGGYADWQNKRLTQGLLPTSEACIVLLSQLINSGYKDILMVQAAGNGYGNGTANLGADAKMSGFFCGVTKSVFDNLDPHLLQKLQAAGITYADIDARILVVGAAENRTDQQGNYYAAAALCYGDTVDIYAPGCNIRSTVLQADGLYGAMTGTSMAAPIVTGCAAYIWSLDPTLSVSQVRALLLDTDGKAIGTGPGANYTYPMVNLGQSVKKLMEH